jgi:hypothetical protein
MDNPFKHLSKPEIYLTIAGGAGVAGIVLVQHHSKTGSWNPFGAATATASTVPGGNDPITGLPYSDDSAVDPATNQQYLAEAEQYGSVAAAEASVGAYGQSTATGSGIPVNPASPASSGSINTPVGTSVYTSNAAWEQAATAGLVSVGYDGPTVAAALGAYTTQTPLSPAQVTIVNTAIGEYGPAPVGNLQIIPQPASGPGNSTPVAAPTVAGGHVIGTTKSSVNVGWTGNNAVKYVCTLTGPDAAKTPGGITKTVTTPSVEYTGLSANHQYSVQVIPYNSSGTGGIAGHVDADTLAN